MLKTKLIGLILSSFLFLGCPNSQEQTTGQVQTANGYQKADFNWDMEKGNAELIVYKKDSLEVEKKFEFGFGMADLKVSSEQGATNPPWEEQKSWVSRTKHQIAKRLDHSDIQVTITETIITETLDSLPFNPGTSHQYDVEVLLLEKDKIVAKYTGKPTDLKNLRKDVNPTLVNPSGLKDNEVLNIRLLEIEGEESDVDVYFTVDFCKLSYYENKKNYFSSKTFSIPSRTKKNIGQDFKILGKDLNAFFRENNLSSEDGQLGWVLWKSLWGVDKIMDANKIYPTPLFPMIRRNGKIVAAGGAKVTLELSIEEVTEPK